VFSVLLASFGSGSFAVRFVFGWSGFVASVVCRASSRSGLARLLWRFRAARAYWLAHPARVRLRLSLCGLGPSALPRFGLRWLAARPCFVSVLVPGRRARSRFVSAVGFPRSPFWAFRAARAAGLG